MQDIEKSRTEIKAWMVRSGISASELAERLGVSVHSVYGWLTKNNIPEKQLRRIYDLMPAPEPPSLRPVAVSLSEEGFHKCLDAARREGFGERVDLWGGKMLEQAADHVLASIAAENSGS